MKEDKWIQTLAHKAQRTMAIRVARCYRTVSYRAATTLSGTPPIELLAKMYQQVYRKVKILREEVGLERATQKEIHNKTTGEEENVYTMAKIPFR